jgi:hypothetical protein
MAENMWGSYANPDYNRENPRPTTGYQATNPWAQYGGGTANPGVNAFSQAMSAYNNTMAALPQAATPASTPAANNTSSPWGDSPWGSFKPQWETHTGFNPMQYATNDTANDLAQRLGGSVKTITTTNGPFGLPPQNALMFPETGNELFNAGLVAQNYRPENAAFADQMMQTWRAIAAKPTNNGNIWGQWADPNYKPPTTPSTPAQGYIQSTLGTAPTTPTQPANNNPLAGLMGGDAMGLLGLLALLGPMLGLGSGAQRQGQYWYNRPRYSLFG